MKKDNNKKMLSDLDVEEVAKAPLEAAICNIILGR